MHYLDDTYPLKPIEIRNQTHTWAGSDTIERYRSYKLNPYTENDVSYKYNNYGFRCDNFIPSNHRLVFLGCSNTEGTGLPLEETFAYIVYKEIKKRIGVEFPYWNLGLSGCGIDSLVRCYYNLHDILKPQVAIILFPNYRLELFDNNEWVPIISSHDPKKIFSRNPILTDPNYMLYNTEKNLAMLDLLIEKNKTFLIWDTWDKIVIPKIKLDKLKNFGNRINEWDLIIRRNKFSPKARDGMHPGKKCHDEYATAILERFGDQICEKLVSTEINIS